MGNRAERMVGVKTQDPDAIVGVYVADCPEGCRGKKMGEHPKNYCPLKKVRDCNTSPRTKAIKVKLGQCTGQFL